MTNRPAISCEKPRLPRLDTTMGSKVEEPMSDRLVTAIAKILELERDGIHLHDSFSELGGDGDLAGELVSSCSTLGMTLASDDVLRCRTIAELQTCLRPVGDASAHQRLGSSPSRESDDASSRISDTFSVEPKRDSNASDSSNSPSGMPSDRNRSLSPEDIALTEDLLTSTSQVPRATLIRPKAGYFEGKLVAFLTLVDISAPEDSGPDDIVLIPHYHHQYAGSQVAALRYLLENSSTITAIPTAWIILEQMPLTQSGACDRRRLQTWIQNMNDDLYQQIMSVESQELLQEASTDMERTLQRLISAVLKAPVDRIGVNFSFKQLGGDEFSALQLVAACKFKGILVTTDDIAQSDSIAHLAFLASYKGNTPSRWEEDRGTVDFGLSPMQQLYFRTDVGGDYEARKAEPWEYRFHQSMLLKINAQISLDDMHAAIEAIVGHHSMLRARFQNADGTWTQSTVADISSSYSFGRHIVRVTDQVLGIIQQSQSSIDIESGPVFAAELIRTADDQQMLFLVAHHLVVDLISWRVIVHDLNELLQNGSLYSERSMPFQKWNELQEAEIKSLKHSLALSFDIPPGDFSFWGLDPSRNTYGDVKEVSFALAPELSYLLQSTCNEAFRTDSTDIYLATLLLSFCQTFPERAPPAIWNQEHGREPWDPDVDIAETVGWFTTLCPLWLDTESSEDFLSVLPRLKDMRRAIPRRGWAYFASRFMGPDAETFASHDWPFEIMFTYGGSLQQLEADNGILEQLPIPGRALGSTTSDIGSRVGRVALFEVSTMMDQGIAKVKFLYNKESKHQDRIATWVSNFEHLLLEAVGRLRYRTQELTLSDVPLLDVGYDGLAKLNSDTLMALNISSPKDIENVYPVTPLQQEILVSQSKSIESCHIHAIFEFSPAPNTAVDSTKLCTAWQKTVAKYPSLRTVFIESVSDNGLFDQVILRKVSPVMLFIDAGPTDDAVAALNKLPALQCAPSEPRHRLSFCGTAKSTFLKLEVSQAICDVTSLEKIAGDLKRAYTCNNVSGNNLGLSYPKYIQSLRDARRNSKVDFWRVHLRGCNPCRFPALWTPAEGRPMVTNFKVGIELAHLDAYCRQVAVRKTSILRLAWGLVLKNYTGSKRVCFGYRHTGRDAPQAPLGIDSAVGAFESTVICSLDLSSHKTLESALQATEDQQSLYLPHQFTPVSEIQHALGLAGTGLFNTCLSYHDEHRGLKSRFNGRSKSQNQIDCVMYYNTLDQDISVSVMANAGFLDVTLAHRILTSAQAENIANAFGCAVKAIIQSPNGSVGGVDLFSERDYAQFSPAAPREDFKRQLPVHEHVELIVKDDPDAPAVASWDGRLCYRQLSRLVSHLARYLVELGVEPGSPVPVLLGKSRWSSVAILAVLKSGGCFVPLDDEDAFFAQRVVKQLKSRIILTTDMTAGKRLGLKSEKLVVVNELLFSAQLFGDKECPAVQMGDPACVVFRSPSAKSGEAKGIFFTHEALSAAFVAQGPALGINIASRVLQLSAFSSDTALSEVLTTLVHGGCVCVPGALERTNDLAGSIQRLEANWTYLTPVLARRLRPAVVPTIQTICFRTRRLDPDTFALWCSKTRVLLSYGTSDICPLGISITEVITPDHLSRIAPPFIGKFWIINPEDHRRLMPLGAVGELAIESPTLAHKLMKGGSPNQTLVAQARRNDEGLRSRFFKTGHRVRYMNDGMLEFITSCRDEVTLDGNVIPVPTVEQHIRRCMGSPSEVVVDVVTTKEGSSTLTAFVELGTHFEGGEDLASLSATTRERAFVVKKLAESHFHTTLPSYMLPAAFVPLKAFPMTSSLKVHRRKLQKMAGNLTEAALLDIATVTDPEAIKTPNIKPLPLTQVEERMRGIWARLLSIDPQTITGTQSFFRLGGDAHLVTNLIIACRKEDLVIPLSAVLQNVSLTELCQSITLAEEPFIPRVPERAPSVKISPTIKHVMTTVAPEAGIEASITDAALATTTQIRSLESSLRASRAGVNHLVLNFSGSMDAKKLEAACHHLVSVHPILSTSFVTHSRKVYQVVSDTEPEFSRVHTPSWRLATVIEKTLKKDQPCAVIMEKPITKFTFVDGGKQSALIIRLSTAQYDDSSLPLLLQDLKRIYAGGHNGLNRPSFVDFARTAAQSNPQAVSHWAALLQGASITRVLSHSRPPKPTITPRTLTASVPVPPAITSELGITFDTVLKAAWSIVLATLSSTPDVTFGEVIDGRHIRVPSQGVSGVVGPLHNAIPVRIRFDVRGTPLELLRCIHEQRVASLPHENLGMYEMVEKCTPWPYWSQFSTVIQHRYREGLGDAARFSIGGADCTASVTNSASKDIPDLFVSSVQPTPETSSLSITFCETQIPTSFVESILNTLVSTIDSLSSLNDAIIPGSAEISSVERQIPLPNVDVKTPANPVQPDPAVQDIIAKAWDELLDPRAHGVPEEHVFNASFYDLWGSLVPGHMLAARLTNDLASHEVSVSMEEIIDNPTQQKQLELVTRKMRTKEKTPGWKTKLLSPKERKPSCDSVANGPEPKPAAAVSPIAEDSDYVFLPMEDVISPLSPAEGAGLNSAVESPNEGKIRRRASKVIGRMSKLSFSQAKTAS